MKKKKLLFSSSSLDCKGHWLYFQNIVDTDWKLSILIYILERHLKHS